MLGKESVLACAITHDLSKFSPAEFFPYAEYFYGEYGVKLKKAFPDPEPYTNGISCLSRSYLECKARFDKAWEHHYKHNKHHWNHWCYDKDGNELDVPRYMPSKYTIQMICDWEAMSIKFGGTNQEFYMNNYDKIKLNRNSRLNLEDYLGLQGDLIVFGITWKEYCERVGITMKEDLIKLGYIKE